MRFGVKVGGCGAKFFGLSKSRGKSVVTVPYCDFLTVFRVEGGVLSDTETGRTGSEYGARRRESL